MKMKQWMAAGAVMSLGMAATAWAASGIADIKGIAPGSKIEGKAALQDTPSGLHVTAALSNLPPGVHGFHIHENGNCGDNGKAAGGHYNPFGAPHGLVMKAGVHHAHAGDLGNITAGPDGKATVDATIPGITLSSGPYSVDGRAFIVHEKADDFSQPAGNAGGRIACGIIKLQ